MGQEVGRIWEKMKDGKLWLDYIVYKELLKQKKPKKLQASTDMPIGQHNLDNT